MIKPACTLVVALLILFEGAAQAQCQLDNVSVWYPSIPVSQHTSADVCDPATASHSAPCKDYTILDVRMSVTDVYVLFRRPVSQPNALQCGVDMEVL